MYWCAVSIIGVVIVGWVLRQISRKITTDPTTLAHVDEFIVNFASGIFISELRIIRTLHGKFSIPLLVAGYIHLFFKFSYLNKVGASGSPLSFIASYYRNGRKIRFSLFYASSIIITQFVALYSAQKVALLVWAFADQSHVDAIQVGCNTAISTSYPLYYIALYEALGVAFGTGVSFLTPPALKAASGALVTMVLYFFFVHISGSFLNPILATALSFRCKGHTGDMEHLLVYWLAPAVGMVVAFEIWLRAGSLVQGKKKVAAKEE